eukprot:jgi/Mesen1/10964/ME000096S10540
MTPELVSSAIIAAGSICCLGPLVIGLGLACIGNSDEELVATQYENWDKDPQEKHRDSQTSQVSMLPPLSMALLPPHPEKLPSGGPKEDPVTTSTSSARDASGVSHRSFYVPPADSHPPPTGASPRPPALRALLEGRSLDSSRGGLFTPLILRTGNGVSDLDAH